MVNANFKIANVDKVHATMNITMTIGDWKQLSAAINDSPTSTHYPQWDFTRVVGELVDEAEKVFYKNSEAEKE